jgi:uncharacterized Tic20 family protein
MGTMDTLFEDRDSLRTEDRIALVLAHGGTCFAWLLAPLLVYIVKRESSPRVAYEALQSLLWSLFGSLAALLTCGLAIPVFLVWHVIGAVRALEGRPYDYPIVADIARRHVYQG